MAIKGSYTFKGIVLPEAVLKVTQVMGSEQGWNAQVSVFANETSTEVLEISHLVIPYRAGEDPIGDAEDILLAKPEFVAFHRLGTPRRLTKLAFLNRFTMAERIAIRTAAKSQVALEDYLALVNVAQYIDITRPDTIAGVQQLEAIGLIGSGRAAEILATEPPVEPPVEG